MRLKNFSEAQKEAILANETLCEFLRLGEIPVSKTGYDVLGIPPSADAEEIKKAYKAISAVARETDQPFGQINYDINALLLNLEGLQAKMVQAVENGSIQQGPSDEAPVVPTLPDGEKASSSLTSSPERSPVSTPSSEDKNKNFEIESRAAGMEGLKPVQRYSVETVAEGMAHLPKKPRKFEILLHYAETGKLPKDKTTFRQLLALKKNAEKHEISAAYKEVDDLLQAMLNRSNQGDECRNWIVEAQTSAQRAKAQLILKLENRAAYQSSSSEEENIQAVTQNIQTISSHPKKDLKDISEKIYAVLADYEKEKSFFGQSKESKNLVKALNDALLKSKSSEELIAIIIGGLKADSKLKSAFIRHNLTKEIPGLLGVCIEASLYEFTQLMKKGAGFFTSFNASDAEKALFNKLNDGYSAKSVSKIFEDYRIEKGGALYKILKSNGLESFVKTIDEPSSKLSPK